MQMLDLFSGMGGASAAMKDRGWKVVTVELAEKFKPDIVADVCKLSFRNYKPDLIWGSPPCTEFSKSWMPWCEDIEPDMTLVEAFHKVVENLNPKWWVLENVQGAVKYMGKPQFISGPVRLWGVFPPVSCKVANWKEKLWGGTHQAERAKMPYNLSKAVAIACESVLPL